MNDQKQQAYTQAGQNMTAKPNAIVAAMKDHRSFYEARLDKIAKWVTQGVRPEAIVRFSLMDIQTNEKLRECSKESIYLAMLACAVTGLEPGALKGEAYLVPFAKKAQFMPGWKGLVKQARRSQHVEAISANVVREGDFFDLDLGTSNTLIHKPLLRGERGHVIGAYAIAKMKGGHFEIEWMDGDDLDKIQRVAESRGKSPAWKDWEDQMQRKSPIRRLCKRLPMGADYFITMSLEDSDDQVSILDMETDGEASRATGSAADIRSARPAQAVEDVIDVPFEESTDPKSEKPDAKPAEKPAAAPSTGPAGRAGKYARGAAPKDEPKTAEPAPTNAPPPGMEERPCAGCGVPIDVPVNDPPNARCYACANA